MKNYNKIAHYLLQLIITFYKIHIKELSSLFVSYCYGVACERHTSYGGGV